MKKKMILSAFALTSFAIASYAQGAVATATAEPVPAAAAVTAGQATTEEAKTKVEATALPAAVQQTLASDQYKEWKLVSAWQIAGAAEYYVLEMQKGEDRATLKLNKDGKPV